MLGLRSILLHLAPTHLFTSVEEKGRPMGGVTT